jgi:hypothetical protein
MPMEPIIGGFRVKKNSDNEIQAILTSWGLFKVGGSVKNIRSGSVIGPVVSIDQPYTGHRTTDVLRINPPGEKFPIRMKLDEVTPV